MKVEAHLRQKSHKFKNNYLTWIQIPNLYLDFLRIPTNFKSLF
jgi:hypothetical protein